MPRTLVLSLLLAGLMACAPAPFSPAATGTPPPAAPLVIYADAAAANVLRDIGAAFMQANPNERLEWTFAEPDALRAKWDAGIKPDLVITADRTLLDAAKQITEGSSPKTISRDPLVVVVSNANPAGIARAEDLNRAGLRVAIAQENTALGQATRTLVENFRHDAAYGPDFPAQFYADAIAEANDGSGVLNALLNNRAAAGIVYASDANVERKRVQVFEIDAGLNVPATYSIVPLKTTAGAERIANFVASFKSPQAQTLWRDYGFEPSP